TDADIWIGVGFCDPRRESVPMKFVLAPLGATFNWLFLSTGIFLPSNKIDGLKKSPVILKKSCVLAVLFCLFSQAEAKADPIVYTLSAVGIGSLGGVSFSNHSFILTSMANTSQITNPFSGIFSAPNTSATVFVTGIGTATFTIPTTTVSNHNVPDVGFG